MGQAKFPYYRSFKSGTYAFLFVLSFYLFLPSSPGFSQTGSSRFEHLTIDDGLCNNFVDCIHQDKNGFIWFGTVDGLNRFDGYSLIKYQNIADDTFSLDNNLVRSIEVNSEGQLFIITDNCINKYVPERNGFIRFNVKDRFKTNNNDFFIRSSYMDEQDNLWIGTAENYLVKFDTRTSTFSAIPFHKPNDKNTSVINILKDRQNNLWFISDDEGVYQLDLDTHKLSHHYHKKVAGRNIDMDNCKSIFINPSNGHVLVPVAPLHFPCIFDITSNQFTQVIIDRDTLTVENIVQDFFGDYWYHTNKGLVKRSKAQKKDVLFTDERGNPQSISTSEINSLYLDDMDCLWIGTGTSGIYKLNLADRKFELYLTFDDERLKYKNPNVHWISVDKDGTFWMATTNCGIINLNLPDISLNKVLIHTDDQPSSLSGTEFLTVLTDKDGKVWIGSGNGAVSVYNKKSGRFTRYRPDTGIPFDSWTVLSMFEDSKDNVWIGFYGGVAKVAPGSQKIMQYYGNPKDQDGFPSDYVNCITEDKYHNIWFASSNTFKGLAVLEEGAKRFSSVKVADHDNPIPVKTLLADDDILWLGTEQKGLVKFDIKTRNIIKIYTTGDGLPNDNICGILKDKDGNLWISTFRGISKFSIKEGTFRNYSTDDGLQSDQFNYNSCCVLPGGRMAFGGVNGLNIFNPDSIRENQFTTRTYLTGFKINNKTIDTGDTINGRIILKKSIENLRELELTYKESDISFEFVGLNYASPKDNSYAYMLEGYDEEWIPTPSSKRYVSYTNLPARKYIFRVKSSNNDALWCKPEEEVALNITITPPFWKTWWFEVIIVVTILVLVYSWYLLRTRHLRIQKIVLERMVVQRTALINEQKEELIAQKEDLMEQKEEMAVQADNLQEVNILLREHGEEMKTFSKKLKEQGEELSKANVELLNLNATKDRLFSIIAHDLRNPFQSIIGLSDTLVHKVGEMSEDKKQEILDSINRSSKYAFDLLENLLEWARSQTNKVKSEPAGFKLLPVCLRVRQLLSLQTSKKNISLEINVSRDIMVYGDSSMVETVIRNIAGNAVKFTPEHGKVIISAESTNGFTIISVSDSGIGMPQETINKLFRIDITQTEPGTSGEKGTGLGLLLCKELTERNNGELTVMSRPGKGSIFSIRLPADKSIVEQLGSTGNHSTQNQVLYQEIPQGLPETTNKVKYRVLIAEDNVNILNNLVANLEDRFVILTAGNGEQALQLTYSEMPDLLVTDVMMPKMDGFELCSHIKNDLQLNHIPVIILTARVSVNNQITGFGIGADEYITKPFNPSLLKARISNILSTRQKLKEKFLREMSLSARDIATSSKDEEFLNKVIGCIEEFIDDPNLNFDQLAMKMGHSRSNFYKKIKALTNLSANLFIRTVRLKKAAILLSEKQHSISEVAYKTGFSSANYFSKLFKEQFGLSPSEFVNKN